MSQNITNNFNDGFNHDFTDEVRAGKNSVAVSYSLQDAWRLVSIASSPELSLHTCRWVEGGVRCSTVAQGLYFPAHLREHHGIHGIGYHPLGFSCQWEGCSETSTFNREGLMKHIQEIHLLWRWNCPSCGAVFMHQIARNAHHARCMGAITK